MLVITILSPTHHLYSSKLAYYCFSVLPLLWLTSPPPLLPIHFYYALWNPLQCKNPYFLKPFDGSSTFAFALTKIWLPVCKPHSLYAHFRRNCSYSLSTYLLLQHAFQNNTLPLVCKIPSSFEVYAAMFYYTSPSLLVSSIDILCWLTHLFSYSSIFIFLRAFKTLYE